MEGNEERLYVILTLDQTYVESIEVYKEIAKAKKAFKVQLRERGLGLLKQRKHLREEYYRDGDWQIQLLKITDIK